MGGTGAVRHTRRICALLADLARRGEFGAAEDHLAATARLFRSEELDFGPLDAAWRTIRGRSPTVSPAGDASLRGAGGAASRRPRLAIQARSSPQCLAGGDAVRRGGRRTCAAAWPMASPTTSSPAWRSCRDFFVIARGSVFALADMNIGPARRRSQAECRLRRHRSVRGPPRPRRASASNSSRCARRRIVWAETFERRADDIFFVLDDIGNSIVSSISAEIEMVERNRAMLKAPNSLNAWEAYHRGLWHMYRFTRAENEQARHFFATALHLDPTFARAYAGLSFTHWQNAFQRWGDRDHESELAFETRRPEPAGRRPQSGGALGDGPRAVAARRARTSSLARTGTGGGSQPEFRARPLRAVLRPLAVGRPASGDRLVRPFAPAQPLRSAAVRHAGHARHGACAARPVRGGGANGR